MENGTLTTAHQTKELHVRIESEGGALTLTPMGLLQHFLPGAQALPNNPRVFAGKPPGRNEPVYVSTEALAGMLMEAREKHINPISGMYLIPSNHPDRPAGHKIKYDVRIERARKIPGFMGLNKGLLVKRGNEIKETHGEVPLPGDQIYGAWAEIYIAGLPRPLRHEVPATVKGLSDAWKKHEGFMYCKVAVDRLLRLNFPSLYANETALPEETEADNAIELEATAPGQWQAPPPSPYAFQPDTLYTGDIATLKPAEVKEEGGRQKRTPGVITLMTEQGELSAYFWSRPECLKNTENWGALIGLPGQMSFTVRPDKTGKEYRYVQEFSFAIPYDETAPAPTGEAA